MVEQKQCHLVVTRELANFKIKHVKVMKDVTYEIMFVSILLNALEK